MKELLFYYPKHFNRSKEGTNPFFDRILEVCDRNGITYDLWEEPDAQTDKPHNVKAKKADAFFWTVTVLRKAISLFYGSKSFQSREKKVAMLLNLLTLGRLRYKRYITISGSMLHLFGALNPRATVYDMQHGVVFKHHPTYFDSRTLRLRPQFHGTNLHFIFWGNGYRDCFIKGEEKTIADRAHVTGYPVAVEVPEGSTDNSSSRLIVVSLQFTNDVSYTELCRMKDELSKFLRATEGMGLYVLLKQHPRYNGCIDISDILARYRHVALTDRRLEDLACSTMLHVTCFSTTAFEFAQLGVPTFFMPYGGKKLADTLYYDEYRYPLYLGDDIGMTVARLSVSSNYIADSNTVKEWHSRFYAPFDENAFLKLLV